MVINRQLHYICISMYQHRWVWVIGYMYQNSCVKNWSQFKFKALIADIIYQSCSFFQKKVTKILITSFNNLGYISFKGMQKIAWLQATAVLPDVGHQLELTAYFTPAFVSRLVVVCLFIIPIKRATHWFDLSFEGFCAMVILSFNASTVV